MRIKAWPFEQQGKKMYCAVMAASDLTNKTQVDVWKVNNPDGYQRAPEESRAKAFSRFIASEISPPALVTNIREKDKDKVKVGDGWLEIPEDVTIWLVDGQHRVRGLQMLLESSDKQAAIEIPVIITLGQSVYEEAKQFVIVNRTQKKVRTDLGERFLQRAVKEEGLVNLINKGMMRGIEWIPTAIAVADLLYKNEQSVWYNKIRLPNEPRGNTSVSQKSFTDSLKPLINPDGPLAGKPEDTIAAIINRYWDAIHEVCPVPFDDAESYVMQRTMGVFVLHSILPRILIKLRIDEPTKDDFLVLLNKMNSMKNQNKWHKEGEFGRLAGQKGFALVKIDLLGELEAAYQEIVTKIK